jgi:hypothetical protein
MLGGENGNIAGQLTCPDIAVCTPQKLAEYLQFSISSNRDSISSNRDGSRDSSHRNDAEFLRAHLLLGIRHIVFDEVCGT